MKVAVVSMADRAGATCATLLIGYAMAYKQVRTTRLCYTGQNSAILKYPGRDDGTGKDRTRSITQVAKLLTSRALKPAELGDYCINLGPNIDLMDSWEESLTEDEMMDILTFCFDRSTTDFTFCDIAYALDDPTTQRMIEVSDAIICVSEMSKASLSAAHEAIEKKKFPEDKPVMLLVNRFDPTINSLKWCANQAGTKLRYTCKIHYNPYITRGCNGTDIEGVARAVMDKDPRVISLHQDLKECTQFLLSLNNEKNRWED